MWIVSQQIRELERSASDSRLTTGTLTGAGRCPAVAWRGASRLRAAGGRAASLAYAGRSLLPRALGAQRISRPFRADFALGANGAPPRDAPSQLVMGSASRTSARKRPSRPQRVSVEDVGELPGPKWEDGEFESLEPVVTRDMVMQRPC